jgi:hypothetical protein
MQQILNPMAHLYQTQLEASRRFADAIFSGTEKLDRLVLEATHRAVNDQLNMATAMANGQDAAGGMDLARTLMQQNSNGAVNYQAEIVRVVAEMQTEIGKSMQEYIEQTSTQAANVPSRAVQSTQAAAPGAADSMINPMTNMLSMWENAFKQATGMATRNMAAARSNMDRAAESAEGHTRDTTRAAEQAAEGAAETTRRAASEASQGGSSSRRK